MLRALADKASWGLPGRSVIDVDLEGSSTSEQAGEMASPRSALQACPVEIFSTTTPLAGRGSPQTRIRSEEASSPLLCEADPCQLSWPWSGLSCVVSSTLANLKLRGEKETEAGRGALGEKCRS